MFPFFLKKTRLRTALFASLFPVLLSGLLFVSCDQPTDGGVNAKPPSISAQPQGGTWNVDTDNSFPLSVTAAVTDGGTLSHQWYKNTSNSTTGGSPIGTNNPLSLSKTDYDAGETYYFYVVVTNTITNNGDGGKKTASVTSSVATVSLTSTLVNAHHPSISVQPQGGTWNVSSANSFTLSVTADSPDDGELSFQWYKNSANNTDGEEIEDEHEATLTLEKEHYTGDGDHYFYVAVKNTITDNGDGGTKTATVTSSVVKVTVSGNGVEAVNAQQPNITVQPTGGFWNIWLTSANATFSKNTAHLTVTASPPDGGSLSYQWYVNSANSESGSTLLTGKTSATLSLTAAEIASTYTTIDNGTNYFYVVVTNTIAENDDGGTKIATRTSTIVNVTLDGVANGIIGKWNANNYADDSRIITDELVFTEPNLWGNGNGNDTQGDIVYVSFFNADFGIMIIKYHPDHKTFWWSNMGYSDEGYDYYGIYLEEYDPDGSKYNYPPLNGLTGKGSIGFSSTSDANNSYGPSETTTLDAAIERFDENGSGRWFMPNMTPPYVRELD